GRISRRREVQCCRRGSTGRCGCRTRGRTSPAACSPSGTAGNACFAASSSRLNVSGRDVAPWCASLPALSTRAAHAAAAAALDRSRSHEQDSDARRGSRLIIDAARTQTDVIKLKIRHELPAEAFAPCPARALTALALVAAIATVSVVLVAAPLPGFV